jgi:hypothetical protein
MANAAGLGGAVYLPDAIPPRAVSGPSIFAGSPPEDKFRIVRTFQDVDHAVGICGDGVERRPVRRSFAR